MPARTMAASNRRDSFLESAAVFPGSMALLCLVLLVAGCSGLPSVGPDYVPPEPVIPDSWYGEMEGEATGGEADYVTWWTILQDPVLDSLIQRSTDGNFELRIAIARIDEARARLGFARGEQYPNVDGLGAVTRSRTSEGVASGTLPGVNRTDTLYEAGAGGSWELDFWGRVRRSIESAEAGYQASVDDYRNAMILLYAEVARTYVGVRTFQERIRVTHANVSTQQETLRLVEARNRAGLVPDLDVQQAKLNLATTESALPGLYSSLAQGINALGVLIGQPPDTLHGELSVVQPIPKPPGQVNVGIPADLLRRRPDIRSAERTLAAQTARIGVATAALYPNFFLTGQYSFATFDGSLFESGNRQWAIGPFFSWNLFDGGRVRSVIDVEEARTVQALNDYEQTVLFALQDVEDAIVAFVQVQYQTAALARAVAAAEESVRLVQILYKTGLTDFQNVQDSEQRLAIAQDSLAESQGAMTQTLIRLYRSLGGGWDPSAT